MAKVIVGMTVSLDGFVNDFTGYEFQVPIFVVTHRPPKAVAKGENGKLSFEFVGDVDSAVQKAKKTAGSKDVTVVGGASIAQQCITSGLADELQIGIVPWLTHSPRRRRTSSLWTATLLSVHP